MRLVMAMVLAGLVALPLTASAQAGEEHSLSFWHDEALKIALFSSSPAPSSEPAPEEPALQLKLDDAGVEVVPSPPRTFDGYTLEEMEVRVRRARLGLGFSVVATTVVGPLLIFVGFTASFYEEPGSRTALPPAAFATGSILMLGGIVGMAVSGSELRRRKRDRDTLREAHYRRPRRVQWDLAQSRVVF
jgi:hypothetical protein